jgi:glycosyltransferase involved in cell wall biosynthesis
MTEKVPMTLLIASHNEAQLLDDRLEELGFCEEILVVDVGSHDETPAVAERHGARVIRLAYSAIGENVRAEVAHEARHDLILAPDPDEEVPPALAEQLAALPSTLPAHVGLVIVPTVYHFRGRPLRGTIWGGISLKPFVARKSGVDFVPIVHRGYRLRPGFEKLVIPHEGDNAIRHHWMSGYREFLASHLHYVRIEGRARALNGEIVGYRAAARTPLHAFYTSFVKQQGYLDGLRGLVLSVLYALYRTGSDLSLIRYLKRHGPPA